MDCPSTRPWGAPRKTAQNNQPPTSQKLYRRPKECRQNTSPLTAKSCNSSLALGKANRNMIFACFMPDSSALKANSIHAPVMFW